MFAITTRVVDHRRRILAQTESSSFDFPLDSDLLDRENHWDAAAQFIHRIRSTSNPRIIGSALLPDWSGWVHLVETDDDREQA